MKIFQKGFNYSQDGAGNRLVYHLQGCNMKCPWCANPEGMKMDGVILADPDWLLESICPYHAIHDQSVNRAICHTCPDQACITLHNTRGMYLSYEEKTPKEILEEALSNEMMFYDGGGVTFTGGEATMQFEELKTVLTGLKEHDIHTAIETNGSHRRLPKLFPLIDQLIIDCKFCDPQKHLRYTGVDNALILENIRLAARKHPRLHIRVPLIGHINDSETDRNAFLTFFREIAGEHVTFEVLSYHEFGKKKWEECGWEYAMTPQAYVNDSVLREFRQMIKDNGCHYERT